MLIRTKKRVSGDLHLLLKITGPAQRLNPIQKCDAKRPCTACISARTVLECVYDTEKRPRRAGAYPSHTTDSYPSGKRLRSPDLVEVPTTTPSHSLSDNLFGDAQVLAESSLMSPTPSDATWAATDEPVAPQVPGDDQVPHGELVLVHRNPLKQRVSLDTSQSIFTIPSCFLPTVPPEPWIPLSFLGEERLQVQFSDTAATELDMRSCVLEVGAHQS
jgi:hypothetical protein